MLKKIKRLLRRIYKYIVRSFKDRKNRNPSYMGRTFAVGFFGAMWVLWGQSGIVLALWLVIDRLLRFRFNLVIGCLATLITNPLTTPFWFYIYYLTGQWMLDNSAIRFSAFARELKPLLSTLDMDGIVNSIKMLVKGIGWPILIGSIPWYAIMCSVGYLLGVRIAIALRRRQHRKKKQRVRRMILYLKKLSRPFAAHGAAGGQSGAGEAGKTGDT
jgi:uncharacterized protein (DUF2062 family)